MTPTKREQEMPVNNVSKLTLGINIQSPNKFTPTHQFIYIYEYNTYLNYIIRNYIAGSY